MRTRRQPHVLSAALAVAVAVAMACTAALTGSVAATDRVVTVQPGDTLSGIAARHGVTVDDLVALNGLANPHRILAGQRLKVGTAPAGGGQSAKPASKPRARTHRVAYGENLTWIARRYGTTVGAIAAANGIGDPSYIRTGQLLSIPGAGGASKGAKSGRKAAQRQDARTHRVAYGENLTWIARRYGTTVGAIAAANGIGDPSYIRTGQLLTIPGAGGARQGKRSAPRAGSGMPASMAALVARRQGTRELIVVEARRQGVPPAFALAVAWQESGWQQGVVSSAGAIGIMQLLPATGEWVGQAMLGEQVDLWNAGANVRAGVRLLRHYLDRYGDRSLALAAYYQGQTAADRHGIYPVSRPYIASILRLEEIFSR